MSYKQTVKYVLTAAILLCSQVNVLTAGNVMPTVSQEDVIVRWNRVLTETVSTPGQHPPTVMPVRSFAMMHAAMFDAVNSIDGSYTPYLVEVPGSKNASIEAAAAKAAHDVLSALYPSRRTVFATEFLASIQSIDDNRLQQGINVGRISAERLLAERANDGWNAVPPSYALAPLPGNWQPTPPGNSAAAFTHYPAVVPFALESSTQFAPGPPPALTSAEYAADLNEVKQLGSANSATRTADQTKVAQLWGGVGTSTNFLFVWNNVARTVALEKGISTVEMARLFALTNIALHDALQTTFASKFEYGLWRPVTAIRRADEDGNADTKADAAWSSLIGSPPYPSYAGNMAGLSASQSTILALFFRRDDIPFQHTWEGPGGATRSYNGFTALAEEAARSRVYGGIHFQFDNVAGQSVGRNVGNYVFQNFMRPRQCVR